jgi:hypothetical protein
MFSKGCHNVHKHMNVKEHNGANALYAHPRVVTDVSQCSFYHHMDLPGIGEVWRGVGPS